jgi:hypothetical protein
MTGIRTGNNKTLQLAGGLASDPIRIKMQPEGVLF